MITIAVIVSNPCLSSRYSCSERENTFSGIPAHLIQSRILLFWYLHWQRRNKESYRFHQTGQMKESASGKERGERESCKCGDVNQIKSNQFYLYSPKSQSRCLNGLYNPVFVERLWKSQLPQRITLQPCRGSQLRRATGSIPKRFVSMNHLLAPDVNIERRFTNTGFPL